VGASSDFHFDASRLGWRDFVGVLREIAAMRETGGVHARLLAPARCEGEARRAIRDLGLEDCVELVEPVSRVIAAPPRQKAGVRLPRVFASRF